MNEISIQELTKEAESGKGCGLQAKLRDLSFEDSLNTMANIVKQNDKNRIDDTSLPQLSLFQFDNSKAAVELRLMPGNSTGDNQAGLSDSLVSDSLLTDVRNINFGKRTMTCSEVVNSKK